MPTGSGADGSSDERWARWVRVVEGRTPSFTAYRPKRIRALRKEGPEAAIDGKTVPGMGAEICSRWTGGAAAGSSGRTAGGTGWLDRRHADDVRGGGGGRERRPSVRPRVGHPRARPEERVA
jgi:hypothetical protein